MEKIKENVLNDFIGMIKQSWTYGKMTEKERDILLTEVLNTNRTKLSLKGTYIARWSILNSVYGAYLMGLGYTPFWRDEEKSKKLND